MAGVFCEAFWGEDARGYDVLADKVRRGNEATKELLAYAKEKAALYDSFIRALLKLNETLAPRSEDGTLAAAYEQVLAMTAAEARWMQDVTQRLQDHLTGPLGDFRSALKKEAAKNDDAYKTAAKVLAKEGATVDKARQAYVAKARDRDKARELAERGMTPGMTKKELIKACEKAIKADKELNLAEMDYHKAVAEWAKVRGKWEEQMRAFAKQVEAGEQDRINTTKRVLASFVTASREHLQQHVVAAHDKALEAISAVDAAADTVAFAAANSTGTESIKPAAVVFRHYATNQPVSLLDPVAPRDRKVEDLMKTLLSEGESSRDDAGPTGSVQALGGSSSSLTGNTLSKASGLIFGKRKESSLRPLKTTNGAQLSENKLVGFGDDSRPVSSSSDDVRQDSEPTSATADAGTAMDRAAGALLHPPSSKTQSYAAQSPSPMASSADVGESLPVSAVDSPLSARLEERLREMERLGIAPTTPEASSTSEAPRVKSAERKAKRQSVMMDPSLAKTTPIMLKEPAATRAPGTQRKFSRRSIKMEGWVVYFSAETESWGRSWVALEGGYLWMFADPADNEKPAGLNKPLSMTAIKGARAAAGHESFDGDIGPEVVQSMPYLFAVTDLPNHNQLLCSVASEADRDDWVHAISRLARRDSSGQALMGED